MYQFATGWDNESLAEDIVPQPRSPGTKQGRVTESLDGSDYGDGFKSVDLMYDVILKEEFTDLCTDFGISSTTRSAQCTISVPVDTNDREFAFFNAIIHYPEILREGEYQYFWKDVIFKVKRLRAIT